MLRSNEEGDRNDWNNESTISESIQYSFETIPLWYRADSSRSNSTGSIVSSSSHLSIFNLSDNLCHTKDKEMLIEPNVHTLILEDQFASFLWSFYAEKNCTDFIAFILFNHPFFSTNRDANALLVSFLVLSIWFDLENLTLWLQSSLRSEWGWWTQV